MVDRSKPVKKAYEAAASSNDTEAWRRDCSACASAVVSATTNVPATMHLIDCGSRPYASARRRMSAIWRSEEHTSELQSLMRISYAVFSLKKKKQPYPHLNHSTDR